MYTRTNFDKVRIFMDSFGQKTLKKPTLPNDQLADISLYLIHEEVA